MCPVNVGALFGCCYVNDAPVRSSCIKSANNQVDSSLKTKEFDIRVPPASPCHRLLVIVEIMLYGRGICFLQAVDNFQVHA